MIDEELVTQIVGAYTSTRMTVPQFEALVREALSQAAQNSGDYDRGFSAGYEEGHAEGVSSMADRRAS